VLPHLSPRLRSLPRLKNSPQDYFFTACSNPFFEFYCIKKESTNIKSVLSYLAERGGFCLGASAPIASLALVAAPKK